MTQANEVEDAVEVVPATWGGRLACALLLAACLLLIAGFQWYALPFMNRLLAAPLSSESIDQIKLGFAGLATLITASALFMIATGWRIVRQRQFPLPNAWVWHDTPLKRGVPAIRIGRLCIGAGIVAFLVCTAMLMYAWRSFDSLVPEQLRPGVSLVKESGATKP